MPYIAGGISRHPPPRPSGPHPDGRSRALRRLVVPLGLVLLVVMGASASVGAPAAGHVTGIWPVGLGTGVVLLIARRRRPLALVVVLAVAVGTIALRRPFDVSVGYGVGAVLEVWIVVAVLGAGGRRPGLRDNDDLRRWIAAVLLGVGAGTAVSVLTCLVTGFGDIGDVALGIAVAHLASQFCVTPFFVRLPDHGAIARGGERVLQWTCILLGTPALFLPDAAPSLVFLVIPILAWGALRITPFESLAQMVATVGLAIFLTTGGRGPFADVTDRYDVGVDVRGVLLSAFAIACAVMVVPLIVRVAEYAEVVRAAQAERDLVRGIVDGATGVAIIVTDRRGRITLFNPGAERLLGYTADEMTGRWVGRLFSERALADKAAELGVADDGGGEVLLSLVGEGHEGTLLAMTRKDGTERTHAITLTRLDDPRGHTTGYVSTSEDVTDRLDAERALRDALEVERRAVEQLRDVDTVKDTFVSTVSHELRTPITSILGYLELLSDGSLGIVDSSQRDALDRVSTNSHRLLSLIDDLLTLSRVAEQGVQPVHQAFDLRAAVEAAYGVVEPMWQPPRRLDVGLHLPHAAVDVDGDREMLERVVVNLLGNAVKFTPDGGAVTLTLSTDGDDAVLRVADTGIGVPEHEQRQLFTRFFRSSLAQGQAIPGSGLGLSITRGIIDRHGGTISVRSTVGKGTTMEARLPLTVGGADG